MNVQQSIDKKIREALIPMHLEVVNESHMHNVPEGAESHFKLVIVSDRFEGELLIKRHRRVNNLLQEEFESGLHALALHTITPEEWFQKGGAAPDSPECVGGKQD